MLTSVFLDKMKKYFCLRKVLENPSSKSLISTPAFLRGVFSFSLRLRRLSLGTPSFPGFVPPSRATHGSLTHDSKAGFALHVLMPNSDLLPVIQYFDCLL